MHVLLLLACDTGSIKLDDTGPAADDTAVDTGEADADTDTDADTDADTDTDTEPPSDAGEYSGSVEGVYWYEDWGGDEGSIECEGDVAVRIDASGALEGEASCIQERFYLTGPIEGWDDGGVVEGAWTVDLGWESVEVPFEGTVAGGVLTITASEDFGRGGAFEAEMTAQRD